MNSIENQIQQHLDLANNSASVAIRNLRKVGLNALLDRQEAMSGAAKIDGDKSLSREIAGAGKRHLAKQHADKIKKGFEAIAAAEAEILRSTPPLPAADSAGAAQIDAELRAAFKALPENQRALERVSDAMKMAVARAPAELTGLHENEHARLVDGILRSRWPEKLAAIDNDRKVIDAARTTLQMHRETMHSTLGGEQPSATMFRVA